MSTPAIMCDDCGVVHEVCEHLDTNIRLLEEDRAALATLRWYLERLAKEVESDKTAHKARRTALAAKLRALAV